MKFNFGELLAQLFPHEFGLCSVMLRSSFILSEWYLAPALRYILQLPSSSFCKCLTLWSCSEVPPSAALCRQQAACKQGSSVSFSSSLPKHTSVGTTSTGGFRRKLSTFESLFLPVPACFRAGPAAIMPVPASLQTDTSQGKSHKSPKVCQISAC